MPVICKYCRTANQEGTLKCSLCGSQLPYTPAPTPVAPQTPPPQEYNVNTTSNNVPPQAASNNPSQPTVSRFNTFEGADWVTKWERTVSSLGCLDREYGLILTNTRGFSGALKNELLMNLTEYINFKASEGVEYFLLDLANQSIGTYTGEIESVIDIIKKIDEKWWPMYIMILGDFATVPNIVWENRSNDPDKVVFSDLPYITLNTESPFNDIHYEFEPLIKVGRIPTSVSSGFKEAFTYLKNARNSRLSVNDLKAFFLSTASWIPTSRDIAKYTRPDLFTSPNGNSFEFNGSLDKYNVLMFNLHGSNGTHYWYGEDCYGNCEPAINASKLPKNRDYIICSEACYGARPFNNNKNADSIVSTALRNGCCAFVGSTQIAWGAVGGGMYCADTVIRYFIANMLDGYSAGGAFNDALSYVEDNRWDDCKLKTIMEFALYGDPSYAPIGAANKSTPKVKKKAFSKNNLAYRVVDGEEQKAVSVKAAYVEEGGNCAVKVRAFVEESHPDMKGIKPRFFIDECTGDYQAVYNKTAKDDSFTKMVKVFFSSDGNIKNQYVTK